MKERGGFPATTAREKAKIPVQTGAKGKVRCLRREGEERDLTPHRIKMKEGKKKKTYDHYECPRKFKSSRREKKEQKNWGGEKTETSIISKKGRKERKGYIHSTVDVHEKKKNYHLYT